MLELAVDLITRDKGFNAHPRDCVIGYGRNLALTGISATEAEIMLYNDLDDHLNEVMGYKFWDAEEATSARRAALLSLHYAIGVKEFRRSHRFIAALQKQDWTTAARWLTDSSQRLGLTNGKQLARLIKEGEE
jgi:GH24 family phage-related lysozyme (muramidase)